MNFQNTSEKWWDESWNPVTGCTPISPGCDNCYARRMSVRLAGRYGYDEKEPFKPATYHADKVNQPMSWKTSKKIFVCSMGDLFHGEVPEWMINEVFHTMFNAPQHTYIILTKRPRTMARYCLEERISQVLADCDIWVGTTVENQGQAERVRYLLQIPAAVRFVSVEPMLGPVDFSQVKIGGGDAFTPMSHNSDGCAINHRGLDWVICGGETGPGARWMFPWWARDLKEQCLAAEVPFFMKQMTSKVEIPPYLQLREFPGWPASVKRDEVCRFCQSSDLGVSEYDAETCVVDSDGHRFCHNCGKAQ